MWRPLALLLAFGGGMGVILAVGKVAIEGGISPLALAAFQNLAAGAVILAFALARGRRIPLGRKFLTFYAVSAATGIAAPHAAMFLALPKLGTGLTAIAYVFPPLFTYALAWMFRLEKFDALRIAALALGFIGTAIVVLPQGALPERASWGWVLFAYAIPLSLAVGNVYRSLAWPGETPLLVLTGCILLTAGVIVGVLALVFGQVTLLKTTDGALWPALTAAALTGFAYLAFFDLQRTAGPVYLSQSGYVVTLVGMGFGLFAFRETYSASVWAGVALILLGVLSVTVRQFARLRVPKPA
jgi:drug/metabolite transporter (DMT)-like permease